MFVGFIIFLVLYFYHNTWSPKNVNIFYKSSPLYIAHRGAPNSEPENTIPSFLSAVNAGLTAIELDVVSTQDGVVVCSHNFDLERKTSAEGYIDKTTFENIKSQTRLIAKLEDVFTIVPKHVIVNIEIKTRNLWDLKTVKEAVRLINKYKISDRTILSSFNPIVLLMTHILNRSIYTAFIVWEKKWIWLIDWIHPDFLHPDYGLVSKDLIRYTKERNMGLNVWTVNSKPGISWLDEIGVDGIITNRPKFCKI